MIAGVRVKPTGEPASGKEVWGGLGCILSGRRRDWGGDGGGAEGDGKDGPSDEPPRIEEGDWLGEEDKVGTEGDVKGGGGGTVGTVGSERLFKLENTGTLDMCPLDVAPAVGE